MNTIEQQSANVADAASQRAGSGPGWNQRFADAVEALGWEILPIESGRYDYTRAAPVWAPRPQEDGWQYPYPSLIVPRGWRPPAL